MGGFFSNFFGKKSAETISVATSRNVVGASNILKTGGQYEDVQVLVTLPALLNKKWPDHKSSGDLIIQPDTRIHYGIISSNVGKNEAVTYSHNDNLLKENIKLYLSDLLLRNTTTFKAIQSNGRSPLNEKTVVHIPGHFMALELRFAKKDDSAHIQVETAFTNTTGNDATRQYIVTNAVSEALQAYSTRSGIQFHIEPTLTLNEPIQDWNDCGPLSITSLSLANPDLPLSQQIDAMKVDLRTIANDTVSMRNEHAELFNRSLLPTSTAIPADLQTQPTAPAAKKALPASLGAEPTVDAIAAYFVQTGESPNDFIIPVSQKDQEDFLKTAHTDDSGITRFFWVNAEVWKKDHIKKAVEAIQKTEARANVDVIGVNPQPATLVPAPNRVTAAPRTDALGALQESGAPKMVIESHKQAAIDSAKKSAVVTAYVPPAPKVATPNLTALNRTLNTMLDTNAAPAAIEQEIQKVNRVFSTQGNTPKAPAVATIVQPTIIRPAAPVVPPVVNKAREINGDFSEQEALQAVIALSKAEYTPPARTPIRLVQQATPATPIRPTNSDVFIGKILDEKGKATSPALIDQTIKSVIQSNTSRVQPITNNVARQVSPSVSAANIKTSNGGLSEEQAMQRAIKESMESEAKRLTNVVTADAIGQFGPNLGLQPKAPTQARPTAQQEPWKRAPQLGVVRG